MVNPEIEQSFPVNMAVVKADLEKIKKRDKELNFRANKTQEYLNQFSLLSAEKAKELYDKIDKLKIPRLREIHIHKIIDLVPGTADELKVILQGYTLTVSAESMKKIAAVVSEFLPKKG